MNKALLSGLLLLTSNAIADHVPGHAKLEWGLGLVAITSPDYIGSENTQNLLLPFPYLKYRGKRLRIDDGIEARLFESPDLLLSISGNGSLPSPVDNPERTGMDQLEASFEVGPSLEYRLKHDDKSSLWLEIPLRFAFSVGDGIDAIGKTFHPRLAWRLPAQHKFDWKLRLAAGPLYADEKFHSYYYNVLEQQVTPDRAAYTASEGYSGFRTDFTYSRRIDKFWLGGFIRYDSMNNSVVEDSPLVNQPNNLTAGIALAWVLSEL